jgi:hypothetical protein
MDNKYWFQEPDIIEEEEQCSMTLAKAKKEQEMLDELEEKDNE